jgi:hypothetical protein
MALAAVTVICVASITKWEETRVLALDLPLLTVILGKSCPLCGPLFLHTVSVTAIIVIQCYGPYGFFCII